MAVYVAYVYKMHYAMVRGVPGNGRQDKGGFSLMQLCI